MGCCCCKRSKPASDAVAPPPPVESYGIPESEDDDFLSIPKSRRDAACSAATTAGATASPSSSSRLPPGQPLELTVDEIQEVRTEIQEAIEDDNSDPIPRIHLAVHLSKVEKRPREEVEHVFLDAVETDHYNIRSFTAYAKYLQSLDDKRGAMKVFKQGSDLTGSKSSLNSFDVYHLLSYAAFVREEMKNDLEDNILISERLLKRCAISAPDNPAALGNYGVFLAYVKNDPDSAERYLRDAAASKKSFWVKTYAGFLGPRDMAKARELMASLR